MYTSLTVPISLVIPSEKTMRPARMSPVSGHLTKTNQHIDTRYTKKYDRATIRHSKYTKIGMAGKKEDYVFR